MFQDYEDRRLPVRQNQNENPANPNPPREDPPAADGQGGGRGDDQRIPRADGAEPRQDNPLEQLIGNPLFQAMARAPAVNAVGKLQTSGLLALGSGPVGFFKSRRNSIFTSSTSYSAPSSLETRSHRSFYCRCVRSPAHERQTTSLRVRWLDLLPDSTRRLLTIIKNQTIDELAAVADELHAVGPSVMATEVGRPRSRPASPGGAASSNSNSVGAQEIAELRAAIVQLTEITREALQRRDQPRGRSRSRTQPRSQSRPRSPTPHRGSTEGYCWYHERYGDVAEQCRGSRVCSHPKARQEKLGVLTLHSAPAVSITIERRLYVTDRTHKIRFLIDSGSVLSILPRTVVRKPLQRKTLELQAANGTTIATYGQHSLTLNLGLRRPFEWAFTIARVDVAIIGADLLSHFGLLIDLRNRRLLDNQTSLSTSCQVGPAPQVHTISVAATGVPVGPCVDAYDAILAEFASDKARPGEMATIVDFPVQHRIVTSGQPVFAPLGASPAIDSQPRRPNSRSCSIGASSGLHRASGPVHCTSCRSLETPGGSRATTACSTPVLNRIDTLCLSSRTCFKRASARSFRSWICTRRFTRSRSQKKTSRRRPSRHLSASSSLTTSSCSLLATNNISAAPTRAPYHLEACEAVRQLGEVPDRTLGGRFRRLPHLRARIRATSSQSRSDRSIPEALRLDTAATLYRHAEFYRRCLPRAAELMSPLTDLLRGLQKKKGEACMERSSRRGIRAHQAGYGFSGTISFLPSRPASCSAHRRLEYGYWCRVESAPRRRRLDAAGFLLAEVITNSAEVLNVRSRAAGHLRGDQIFSEDTRGSKLHHHDRSSPSVLRPRAEVGQVLASTVTSARLHLALRCQDRLHARRREPSGRRSISHRRDYDANDAQLGPNQRGTAEGRTQLTHLRGKAKLKLHDVVIDGLSLVCVEQRDGLKPYLPESLRRQAFDTAHTLSHPSGRATVKRVALLYFWPSMSKDIVRWAKQCVPCQQSKVHRHNRAELGNFVTPDGRFDHVHIDIVKMPLHQGFQNCLTMIDRYTRWPQAIPIGDMSAQTVAKAFFHGWISFLAHRSRSRLIRAHSSKGSSSLSYASSSTSASVSACSASPVRLQGPGNERLRVSSARHHSQAARAAVYRTTQSHPPHQRAKLCRRRKWRRQDALYRSAQASLPGCRRQRSITGNTGAANYHAAFINTESHLFTPCANCPVH
ncbi:unnamed protein product [Trichogramma brassicae]|uniref:RNA-directed DNA polymerase n=1 Tax=Trichogramma brassicae TaxID=86971 RepID=A0A6H5I6G8_9HYME|nr:unnamed protein product [Trichogramma brassicae]